MLDVYLWIASALSGAWFLVHFFIGGRQVAGPLRASTDLGEMPRAVAWMCWHMVSITLFLLATFFAGAILFDMPGLGWAGVLIAAGLSGVGLIAAPFMSVSYRLMPQGFLFLPIVILGVLGLG
ncbi:MAG: hypothetical protein AAGG57_09805 [Pseudomonadota bacterium]